MQEDERVATQDPGRIPREVHGGAALSSELAERVAEFRQIGVTGHADWPGMSCSGLWTTRGAWASSRVPASPGVPRFSGTGKRAAAT